MNIQLFKKGYYRIILGLVLIILSFISFFGFYALYLIKDFSLIFIFLMYGCFLSFLFIGIKNFSKGREYLRYAKNKNIKN